MRTRALTLVDLAVAMTVLALFFAVFGTPLVVHRDRGKSASRRCANNLRQIAMAAIQYADDKRFFPHLSRLTQLDGGYASNTAPVVMRSLVNMGYLDHPEVFVCPASDDAIADRVGADARSWRWRGATGPAAAKPTLLDPDPNDVPLDRHGELSYGWTRRGYTSGSRSTSILVADKARRADDACCGTAVERHVGNHRDFSLVGMLDGHVGVVRPEGDGITCATLSATTPTGGYMGVIDVEH